MRQSMRQKSQSTMSTIYEEPGWWTESRNCIVCTVCTQFVFVVLWTYFRPESKLTVQQVRTGYKLYKQYNFKIMSTTRVLRRSWTSCSGSFVAYSIAYRIERFLGKGNPDSHERPGLESTCRVPIGWMSKKCSIWVQRVQTVRTKYKRHQCKAERRFLTWNPNTRLSFAYDLW